MLSSRGMGFGASVPFKLFPISTLLYELKTIRRPTSNGKHEIQSPITSLKTPHLITALLPVLVSVPVYNKTDKYMLCLCQWAASSCGGLPQPHLHSHQRAGLHHAGAAGPGTGTGGEYIQCLPVWAPNYWHERKMVARKVLATISWNDCIVCWRGVNLFVGFITPDSKYWKENSHLKVCNPTLIL